MNTGNNFSQQQKSQISIQRGQNQKTNAGVGIPAVEQHQPHCCLNPQNNYGYCLPQGQGPPQNGALIQQQLQHASQANPNICGYCHCQCHYQHPTVSPPPAFPICYQQISPQGTSRSYVSTSPSPYHISTAVSSPEMPFNPLMQTPGCIPTFTTSYTYPADTGANQQPNTSSYHMYVSTTAMNVDDPRAAGLKAIKSQHEDTSDSHGVTSDSSSEQLTTRPGWKWESVPASNDKQRSQGKIPRDEYKNQNVRQTTSTSSKKYFGSNADNLGEKGTGSSNKKIEIAKDARSSAKVSNSYAKDGNSYVREGDSYARPTTYTVREDQASSRSGGRRVSISSNPPTKEPIYSAPLNVKDELTDRTENNRLSEGMSAKTGSARRSGVQKIKKAVRPHRKVQPMNNSPGLIGKQIERTEDKDIVKIEESYVVDVEEVLANDIVPLEEVEEIGNEYLAEDSGTGASSNNEEYYEDPAMSEKERNQDDIDLLNNIADQIVGINEVDTLPEKGRDSENKGQSKFSGSYAGREANRLKDERGSYEKPTSNLNKQPVGDKINGLPEKGRDNDSEKKSRLNSLETSDRRNAASDRGSYKMSKTNLIKELGIKEVNDVPEKGRDNDTEKKSRPKSFGTNSGRDTNRLSNERGRRSYEIPKANLFKEPGIIEVNGIPEKGRHKDTEKKIQPKFGTNSGKDAKRLSNERGRRSYEIPKANLNKEPRIVEVNGIPEKGRDKDAEKKFQPKFGTNSGKDANRLSNERGRDSYEVPKANLNKEPKIIEVNGIPEKGRDNDNEKKSQPKSLGTNSGRDTNRLSNERGRDSYEMPNTNSNKGSTVPQKNILPNLVVSDMERAAATQTSGIPLPTKTIPVEPPKTEPTWEPNVTRRSVDQQSQTGKFPRKKTLEMLSKLSLESFDKLISSFVGISLYDKDERVASLINAILESAEPEMEGSSTLRNTLYIPPEVFDDQISGTGGSSKYRLPGGFQHRKNERTTSLQKPGYLKNLSPPNNNAGPIISSNKRKATVKNIIQEFSNNRKFDDTLSDIKETFPGEKIDDFVETLSKHAEKMTDDKEIEHAGRLVRLLIGNRDISKKEAINVISSALVDLPQNLIDSPMAATSTAQYLVEIFSEESNFDWLFQIGTKLIQTDDARTSAAWKDLSINTLKMLHAKTNEN